jgi:hypothetical protein
VRSTVNMPPLGLRSRSTAPETRGTEAGSAGCKRSTVVRACDSPGGDRGGNRGVAAASWSHRGPSRGSYSAGCGWWRAGKGRSVDARSCQPVSDAPATRGRWQSQLVSPWPQHNRVGARPPSEGPKVGAWMTCHFVGPPHGLLIPPAARCLTSQSYASLFLWHVVWQAEHRGGRLDVAEGWGAHAANREGRAHGPACPGRQAGKAGGGGRRGECALLLGLLLPWRGEPGDSEC